MTRMPPIGARSAIGFVLLASCGVGVLERSGPARLPIVAISDPAEPTHFITLGNRGPRIGFSDAGGGYINFVDLGSGNICEPKYGRGWQSAIRDWLHWGRYNPTQGGFSATAGVPVRLQLGRNVYGGARLAVSAFNVPLFADPVFDFTEHEDLVADWSGYDDGDTSDTDGLDETAGTQDDELRSEFDFASTYEDASHLAGGHVRVLRQVLSYTYQRPPRAILQFGVHARQQNGSGVIREAARVRDISPHILPGLQRARDVDLGLVVFVTQEIRVIWEAGYHMAMWLDEAGAWQSARVQPGRANFTYLGLMDDQNLQVLDDPAALPIGPNRWAARAPRGFALLATDSDPDSAAAIAVYIPQASAVNARPVVGLDKSTGTLKYEEDRRMRHYVQIGRVANSEVDQGFAQLGMYLNLTGLIAPSGDERGTVEALRQEVFVLFGSPNEIRAGVDEIARTYQTRVPG